jgi:hypothetical protein
MRRPLTILLSLVVFVSVAAAGPAGKIIKVLPQYLDTEGRTTLAPSLYGRDAYQAQLLAKPELRGGLVFNVQWKSKSAASPRIFVEARGVVRNSVIQSFVWEKPVTRHGWFSQWETITVPAAHFKQLETLSAWRVTIWDGNQLLGEQKSFLW